jgi:hypothetical protein
VIDKGVGDRLRFERDVNHLMDAAARRVGFEIPEPVRRARVETQTAVNAASVVFVDGMGARNHGIFHRTMIRSAIQIVASVHCTRCPRQECPTA